MIKKFFSILHYFRKLYRKFRGKKTCGARAIIVQNNKILLIAHRYNDLWVLPGGKIDPGYDAERTIIKELKEEVGVEVEEVAYRQGIYQNKSGGKNDEVYVFVISKWGNTPNFKRDFLSFLEIKDVKWFDLSNLPPSISKATKSRIIEFQMGKRDLLGDW